MAHFVTSNRVQFHHTDLAGIVHFSHYFRYFEEAEHEMFRAIGHSVHPNGSETGWPRISCSFTYSRPLFFEETFDLHLTIEKIGTTSLTLTCDLIRGESLIAKGQSTSVFCAKSAEGRMEKQPIPGVVRSALQELLDQNP